MLRVLHGHFMKLTLNQAIKKGVEAHQAGDIKEAEKLYKYVLQSQPANPDANQIWVYWLLKWVSYKIH